MKNLIQKIFNMFTPQKVNIPVQEHSRWSCTCADCRNDYHDWLTSFNQGLE